MFLLKNWLKQAYVNGVKSGEFSTDFIAIKCAEQVDKGRFSDIDVEEIYNLIIKPQTATIEETLIEENTIEEVPIEETTEETPVEETITENGPIDETLEENTEEQTTEETTTEEISL